MSIKTSLKDLQYSKYRETYTLNFCPAIEEEGSL